MLIRITTELWETPVFSQNEGVLILYMVKYHCFFGVIIFPVLDTFYQNILKTNTQSGYNVTLTTTINEKRQLAYLVIALSKSLNNYSYSV